jgi:hypothetical protein
VSTRPALSDRARSVDVSAPVLLLVGSVVVWSASLRRIRLGAMDDTGLVSVLPATSLLAFTALTLGFCLALARGAGRRLLVAYVVGLVVMGFGTVSLVGETLRGAVVWRHLGVAEGLVRMRHPDASIDAYFNWPGFFMLLAMVQTVAGADTLTVVARWAPVLFNVLYLGPLVIIARTFTRDRTVVWMTCWVFLVANWVNQDYLSPQALAFFSYLVVLAILLRRFGGSEPDIDEEERSPHVNRGPLLLVVVLLFGVTVASHQLTPFALLAAVSLLVAARRCSARGLPLIMGLILAWWMLYPAATYVNGHVAELTSEIGDVSSAVGKNVGERVQGTPGHLFVVRARMLFTAMVWGMAAIGAHRLWRRRQLDLRIPLLAAAPFPLLILQPYGGEMLLRVHLFSLPFAALLAASALVGGRSHRLRVPIVVAVLTMMLAGFLVSRYGNERMDQFTAAEVAAVDRLYEIVPPGGLLVAASGNLPWKHRDYERYDYLTAVQLVGTTPTHQLGDVLEDAMQRRPASALIFTRSQRAAVDLLGTLPQHAFEDLRRRAASSGRFRLLYANADASIYVLDSSAP